MQRARAASPHCLADRIVRWTISLERFRFARHPASSSWTRYSGISRACATRVRVRSIKETIREEESIPVSHMTPALIAEIRATTADKPSSRDSPRLNFVSFLSLVIDRRRVIRPPIRACERGFTLQDTARVEIAVVFFFFPSHYGILFLARPGSIRLDRFVPTTPRGTRPKRASS